jgi:hypothetical protein
LVHRGRVKTIYMIVRENMIFSYDHMHSIAFLFKHLFKKTKQTRKIKFFSKKVKRNQVRVSVREKMGEKHNNLLTIQSTNISFMVSFII